MNIDDFCLTGLGQFGWIIDEEQEGGGICSPFLLFKLLKQV
jgi:hypothetical protein